MIQPADVVHDHIGHALDVLNMLLHRIQVLVMSLQLGILNKIILKIA